MHPLAINLMQCNELLGMTSLIFGRYSVFEYYMLDICLFIAVNSFEINFNNNLWLLKNFVMHVLSNTLLQVVKFSLSCIVMLWSILFVIALNLLFSIFFEPQEY